MYIFYRFIFSSPSSCFTYVLPTGTNRFGAAAVCREWLRFAMPSANWISTSDIWIYNITHLKYRNCIEAHTRSKYISHICILNIVCNIICNSRSRIWVRWQKERNCVLIMAFSISTLYKTRTPTSSHRWWWWWRWRWRWRWRPQ